MKYILVYILFLLPGIVWAEINVTNNWNVSPMTITDGVSDSDLARGIATALATNHPFDFSTTDWQASVNAAFYDDEDAVSFGIGKRFDAIGDALWHGSYSQNGSIDAFTVGAVFRF